MTAFRHLLVLLALLLAAPAVQAQQPQPQRQPQSPGLYQQPGANSPTSKDQVELYSRAQDQIMGRVSIPDYKASLLVQPEGREWREFRMVLLPIIAGAIILGMIVLLLLFYLIRGTVRIHGGRSGRLVPRFGTLDRFAHWTTAVSFLVMALTGLVVTFGRWLLIPLFGHSAFTPLAEASKFAHNFFSVPFVAGLLLMLVLWVRDNIPERADLTWLKTMGGLFSKQGEHPETGRFNAGQKGIFWSVIFGGGALAVSGYMLMFPFYVTGIGGMQVFHVIHAIVAALLIGVIIAHIYIGSIGMEGAFDAMGRGEVDENWAKDHHRGWYNQLRRSPQADPTPGVGHRAAE